ncbi:MAG: 50S ribosomal protein L6 [Bdellovibrionales bacterium]|nr:50S ribosomal protein L6 [Bdellovibrionales bacterium]
MSRIGKNPINVPGTVKVQILPDSISVEGPNGKLNTLLNPFIDVEYKDNVLKFSLKENSKNDLRAKSAYGLYRSLVSNMVQGCAQGFKKELDVMGVGYKAAVKGNVLELSLGFSHIINYPIPEGIKINVEKQTHLIIEGADRRQVGQVAAEIRSYRKPEPYKGKGVKYADETIIRKAGKSATGSSG